ncbi:hypothetical protein [Cystobacter fuscus]|uniref:hypothetical protein n=1 Tax=Cystobacter fuscus TaxID=43 RepID=UPI000BB2E2A8|nr:hypothetical protein [Cystobacter fuscus]
MVGLASIAEAQNVTLTDYGTYVVLSNGLVSATVTKANATITKFTTGSSPNLTTRPIRKG